MLTDHRGTVIRTGDRVQVYSGQLSGESGYVVQVGRNTVTLEVEDSTMQVCVAPHRIIVERERDYDE